MFHIIVRSRGLMVEARALSVPVGCIHPSTAEAKDRDVLQASRSRGADQAVPPSGGTVGRGFNTGLTD